MNSQLDMIERAARDILAAVSALREGGAAPTAAPTVPAAPTAAPTVPAAPTAAPTMPTDMPTAPTAPTAAPTMPTDMPTIHAETIPGYDAVMVTDGVSVLAWSHGNKEEKWVRETLDFALAGGNANVGWSAAVWAEAKGTDAYKAAGFEIHRVSLPSGLPLVHVNVPFEPDGFGQSVFVMTGPDGRSTTSLPKDFREAIRAHWWQADGDFLPVDQSYVDALCAD